MRRNPEDVGGREQWATAPFLAMPGLLGSHPDLLTWGEVTQEARGLGFLVMMCDVRLQTITPANVPQDQLFRTGGTAPPNLLE